MSDVAKHRWRFFRSGGFDQVRLDAPEDLARLRSLDQKLWTALACPVAGLEFDARTLTYLDNDNDGRIRAPELLAAVDWTLLRLQSPGVLFEGDGLPLSALADNEEGRMLLAAARRLLANLGRPDADAVTMADTDDMAKVFPPEKPNGDGIVPAAMVEDDALKAAMADIITTFAMPGTGIPEFARHAAIAASATPGGALARTRGSSSSGTTVTTRRPPRPAAVSTRAAFHAKPPSTTVDGAGCLPLPPASAAGATSTTTSQ